MDDDEGCIIYPRSKEEEERPWARVAKVLLEIDERRRAALREPLEIWGDIIIKGRQYQKLTVHGDMRLGGNWTMGQDTIIDGVLFTGPLVEEGVKPFEPVGAMMGGDSVISFGSWTANPDGKFTPSKPKKLKKSKGHPKWMPYR